MTKFVKFNGIGWDIQKEKDEKCSPAKINFRCKAPITQCE